MEFFIINHTSRMWNEILEILKKKVKQGVEVRVMYDGMGCIVTLPRKYNEYLERQGIKCRIIFADCIRFCQLTKTIVTTEK